jgi:hypothetical protein
MILYRIRHWKELYENNRTRDLKRLNWVPIPTDLDGDGYTLLISRGNGAALYGAWVGCVIVASRCDPRGTLLRRGGEPHNSASLSRITRIPEAIIDELLTVAVNECKWLDANEMQEGAEIPQEGAGKSHDPALKGREGKLYIVSAQAVEFGPGFPTTESQAVQEASLLNIPSDFVKTTWNLAAGRGGRDSKQAPIPRWSNYVSAMWSFEQDRKAREKSYGANQNTGKPNPRNAGIATDPVQQGRDIAELLKRREAERDASRK